MIFISPDHNWLVVEPTHLKIMSQNENFPQKGMQIKQLLNHHLDKVRYFWGEVR